MIFVPCTPNEQLKKKFEQAIRNSSFRIKVVEKSGKRSKTSFTGKIPSRRNNARGMTASSAGQEVKAKEVATERT